MTTERPRSSANGTKALQSMLAGREGAAGVPRVVLAGEANSGKTTLVNFLLQAQLLVADIVPNTPCPTLLRFGETAHLRVHGADGSTAMRSLADLHRLGRERVDLVEVYLPSAVLRRMEILDLPGFASLADAEAKSHWVRAADIQIWCTLATQAWKASEQAIWTALAAPKSCSFLVVTHRDLLSEKQLGDVAGRMSRETQRYFSQWTAIATPEAIAARNPRGEVVKKEVWASTGVEDFMKKLVDLLQSVLTQRRDAPPPPRAVSTNSRAPHPLAAFTQIRQRATGGGVTAEQTAAVMAGEFDAYLKDSLRPWIAAHCRSIAEAEMIDGLVPKSSAEIVGYLLPQPADPSPFMPADIVKQIEAELAEAFQTMNQTAF